MKGAEWNSCQVDELVPDHNWETYLQLKDGMHTHNEDTYHLPQTTKNMRNDIHTLRKRKEIDSEKNRTGRKAKKTLEENILLQKLSTANSKK